MSYDRALAGQRFELLTWVNDPRADQTYKSIEVAAFKRMSNGWQFAASVHDDEQGCAVDQRFHAKHRCY